MAEWSDDTGSSSIGDHGAESRLASKKVVKDKRPQDEAMPTADPPPPGEPTAEGPSKGQSARDQAGRGKKKTRRAPTTLVLQEVALDIPHCASPCPEFLK